jgi:hypothetical protein
MAKNATDGDDPLKDNDSTQRRRLSAIAPIIDSVQRPDTHDDMSAEPYLAPTQDPASASPSSSGWAREREPFTWKSGARLDAEEHRNRRGLGQVACHRFACANPAREPNIMAAPAKAEDPWPLVPKVSRAERIELSTLALAADSDGAAYRAQPPSRVSSDAIRWPGTPTDGKD